MIEVLEHRKFKTCFEVFKSKILVSTEGHLFQSTNNYDRASLSVNKRWCFTLDERRCKIEYKFVISDEVALVLSEHGAQKLTLAGLEVTNVTISMAVSFIASRLVSFIKK